jgi:hypothetical protein
MRGQILATPVIKALTEMLKLLGAETEEGRDVLRALSVLTKRFGKASEDLTRQEVKLLGERAAPVQAPGPQNMQAFQQMIKSRLGGMAPPGAPPTEPAAPPPAAAAAA